MSDVTITARPQPIHESGEQQTGAWSPLWQRVMLGVVMLISLFMNFYQLGQNGFGNAFYAAGVRSMLDNVHNFFFVSYDPGGFVTLDKPPLGFWLQVISSKFFGFTPFSVYLPQALSGVFSVLILYHLVRRHFGITAGILAALALAITPISVITNRNNTIDSTLVLTMLLGAWAVLKASETGKLRWLLVCALMVGLGFNIKAAEALLVVPAFGLLYLLGAPKKIWTRIWHLAVALAVMLVIALSWSVIVDTTPASQRPYVGSSQDNSEIGLALGYNGAQRLLGNIFGRGARNSATTPSTSNGTTTTPPTGTGQPPTTGNGPTGIPGGTGGTGTTGAGSFGGAGGGGGGGFNVGTAGPLRLFNEPLGGQIVWLLPFALLGILALAWQRRPRFQEDPEQKSLILWGIWLLTTGIFFSVAGFFHQYYLSTMAPAVCALFGIGVVVMWNDYRRRGWRGWLLPIALILTALEQIHIITSNPAWGIWLIPIIAITCFLAALLLIVVRLFPRIVTRVGGNERRTRFSLQGIVLFGLLGLMITSAVWSTIPVLQNDESQLPTAGPGGNGGFGAIGRNNGDTGVDTKLISYLEAHLGNAKYLLAVSSSMQADSIILSTNKPVMAMGGFSGSDPILTTGSLQTLIANGTVRFFLVGGAGGFSAQNIQSIINDLPANIRQRIEAGGFGAGRTGGFGGGAGGFGAQSSLTSWVTQHCSTVSANLWKTSSGTTGNAGGFGGGSASGNLYDCASVK